MISLALAALLGASAHAQADQPSVNFTGLRGAAVEKTVSAFQCPGDNRRIEVSFSNRYESSPIAVVSTLSFDGKRLADADVRKLNAAFGRGSIEDITVRCGRATVELQFKTWDRQSMKAGVVILQKVGAAVSIQ